MGVKKLEWWCFPGQRLWVPSSLLFAIPLFSQNHLSRPVTRMPFRMCYRLNVIGFWDMASTLSDWLLGVS